MNRHSDPLNKPATGAGNVGADEWSVGREAEEPPKPTLLPKRLVEAVDCFKSAFSEMWTKRRLRLIDKTHDDDQSHEVREGESDKSDHSQNLTEEREKYRQLNQPVDNDEFDLSGDRTVDNFLDSVDEHYAFGANNYLASLRIPMEEVTGNKHIRQLAVNWLGNLAAGHTDPGDNYPLCMEGSLAKDSCLFNVLEEISASDDGKKLLVDTINRSGKSVQELGDLSVKAEKDNILHRRVYERLNCSSKKERAFASKLLSDLTKYNHLVKQLGWQLPQDDRLWSGQPFCSDYYSRSHPSNGLGGMIGAQDIIYKVGLVDSHDIDRLYRYQYRKLKGASPGEADRQYFINPDLEPSGDDEVANYWHEQSKYLGATAMQTCIGCASTMAEKEGLALSDLIDESGALRDAFFKNSPESLLGQFDVASLLDHYYVPLDNVRCAQIAKFLEAHRDQTNEDDGGRMLVDFISSKLKNDDDTYDARVIEQFRHFLGPRFVAEFQQSLGSKQDKKRFYDDVFLQYCLAHDCLDTIMPRLNPDWKSHYSNAEKAYFKFISKVNSNGSHDFNYTNYVDADSAGKLRQAIAHYFDANGPTDELISQMLLKDMNLLRKHSELYTNATGLSDSERGLFKFCQYYRANNSNIKKWGLNSGNLDDYFRIHGPTGKLIDQILLSDIDFLRNKPDLRADLSGDRKALLKFRERYGISDDEMKKYQLTPDNLTDYFDANGPKPKFWQGTFLSDAYDLDLIYKYYQNQNRGKAGKKWIGLTDKQIAVMEGYGGIDEGNDWNRPRQVFESYIREHYDELITDRIKQVSDIITRLMS